MGERSADPSAGNIFISYRRGADSNAAGRLYDRLERHFKSKRLFFDIDAIPFGADFAAHIDQQVAKCDVMLVVIGPSWVEAIPRLSSEDDFVRIEIEAALRRDTIPVVPVLVDGAELPDKNDLPANMADLVGRNAFELGHNSFAQSVDKHLVPSLKSQLKTKKTKFGLSRLILLCAIAILVIAGAWYTNAQLSRFDGFSGAPASVKVGNGLTFVRIGRGLCAGGTIDRVEWPVNIRTAQNQTLKSCALQCPSITGCTGFTYQAPNRECVFHESKITRIMGPDDRLYCYLMRSVWTNG